MSDWDRKFAKIVADTERHLASVKSQLHSDGASKMSTSNPLASSVSPFNFKSSALPSSPAENILKRSGLKPTSLLTEGGGLSPPPKRNVSFEFRSSPGGSSPTLTLLSEKLRDQQKEITALRESLNSFQFYMKEQHNQMRSLKDEMHTLELKLTEGGLGLKIERRLQQLKRELMREVDAVKKMVPMDSSVQHATGRKLSSLTNELHGSKLQMSENISSLQRELSAIKSKLVIQESKVETMEVGLKDIEKRQDRTNKALSEVGEGNRVGSNNSDNIDQRLQLQKTKYLLSRFEHRLDDLEDAVFRSATNKVATDSDHTHSTTPSYPLCMSDLNSSSCSLSTTTKPKTWTTKRGERKKENKNPLLDLPKSSSISAARPASQCVEEKLHRRLNECAVDDLESVVSLEGSELEEHSLSSSLDMTSDVEDCLSDELSTDLNTDSDGTI